MKGTKVLSTLVGAALVVASLGVALPAEAATLTTAQVQAVTTLLQAFGVDAATIATVQQALTGTSTNTDSNSTSTTTTSGNTTPFTGSMIGYLRFGDSGANVRALQALLAANSNIYPEGIVSGYFGRLTQLALKRYQKMHGLEQVGFIGPRTLRDLDDDLQSNPLASNNSATTSQNSLCAIVPPGHLIAPGWKRHHEGEEQLIPTCQTLPPGIAYHHEHEHEYGNGGATSTPSAAVPVISAIAVSSVSDSGATVTWTTDKYATSVVDYGTDTSYGSTAGTSASLAQSHSVTLTGLAASTTYHFRVTSVTASSGTATSSDMTFTTSATPDTTAPAISSIAVTNLSDTGASVTWTTNEAATSIVHYGTDTSYGSTAGTSATFTTSHSVDLTGLTASTTYHFQVTSADSSGNTATSSDMTFTTTAAPDTTPPTISAISVGSIASTSASISWTTDEPSTSAVYYSTATPIDFASALSVSSSGLVTSHTLTLSPLTATTTYYYAVVSADAAGNAATSTSGSFVTTN